MFDESMCLDCVAPAASATKHPFLRLWVKLQPHARARVQVLVTFDALDTTQEPQQRVRLRVQRSLCMNSTGAASAATRVQGPYPLVGHACDGPTVAAWQAVSQVGHSSLTPPCHGGTHALLTPCMRYVRCICHAIHVGAALLYGRRCDSCHAGSRGHMLPAQPPGALPCIPHGAIPHERVR